MSTPYTYRITCIPTGQSYYGVRYAKNCDPLDLWVSYFTSSTLVHKLIKYHGPEQFIVEVRKTFKSKEKACYWEHEVLRRLNAMNNPMWINLRNGTGIPCNDNKLATIGKSNKGRKRSQKFRVNKSTHQKQITWMYDPTTNREVQAQQSYIKFYCSQGFAFGRAKDRYSNEWKLNRSRLYSGKGNPAYNKPRPDLIERNKQPRQWLTNGVHTTKVTLDKVAELVNAGYRLGRK